MSPQRIQRQRTKGWRTPLCSCGCGKPAIYVGRPTVWGNPFRLRDQSSGLVHYGPKHTERFGRAWDYEGRISADGASHHMWFAADDVVETYVRWANRAELVELYRLTLTNPTPGMLMAYPSAGGYFASVTPADIRANLAGHDLMCWCPLEDGNGNRVPCHADVLLELANQAEVGR